MGSDIVLVKKSIITHDFITGHGFIGFDTNKVTSSGYVWAPYIPVTIHDSYSSSNRRGRVSERYRIRQVDPNLYGVIRYD